MLCAYSFDDCWGSELYGLSSDYYCNWDVCGRKGREKDTFAHTRRLGASKGEPPGAYCAC